MKKKGFFGMLVTFGLGFLIVAALLYTSTNLWDDISKEEDSNCKQYGYDFAIDDGLAATKCCKANKPNECVSLRYLRKSSEFET